MSSLAELEKRFLLDVARRALNAAVQGLGSFDALPYQSEMPESGGAFVTLHRRGRLRGCIGQIGSNADLVQIVAYCAKGAALEDPRFEPVNVNEVAEIDIELSILSRPEAITPERIEAGKHGLIVSRGWQRGVLLPQVAAQYGWTATRFLEETCIKAGFDRTAWKESGTLIHAFTAEVFSEREFLADSANVGLPRRTKPRYSTSI